mgnify:CR=1 FL=1
MAMFSAKASSEMLLTDSGSFMEGMAVPMKALSLMPCNDSGHVTCFSAEQSANARLSI